MTRTPHAPSEGDEIYRIPARSVGMGAVIRRRTPAGAWVDHVVDRIELRAGDEVRIDMVDPTSGWGAFLVLDGSADVDIVDGPPPQRGIGGALVDAAARDDAAVAGLVQSTLDGLDRNGRACDEQGCVRAAGHDGPHMAADSAAWKPARDDDQPNIGDTCCGACPGGTCYVDQITGA